MFMGFFSVFFFSSDIGYNLRRRRLRGTGKRPRRARTTIEQSRELRCITAFWILCNSKGILPFTSFLTILYKVITAVLMKQLNCY